MDSAMLIEIVGYLGSVLVVVSMLMSSVVKLRIINMIGSIVSGVYALIVGAFPLVLMNGCLIIINIYNLHKLLKSDHQYDLVEGNGDDTFLLHILEHYKEDIKTYFPEFVWKKGGFDAVYMVFCDAVPAGVLIGKMKMDGEMQVLLDYSTPTYRDCSVGEYLYSKLPERGVSKLVFSDKSQEHEGYMKKMGFVQENGVFVKYLQK